MSNPKTIALPAGWRDPGTAPTNGQEFEYLCNDGRVRVGSLNNDLGGSTRRDDRMIGWRQK